MPDDPSLALSSESPQDARPPVRAKGIRIGTMNVVSISLTGGFDGSQSNLRLLADVDFGDGQGIQTFDLDTDAHSANARKVASYRESEGSAKS